MRPATFGMPLYRYTGRDTTGRAAAGKMEAESPLAVARQLDAQGLFATSIEPAGLPVEEKAPLKGFRARFGRAVPRRDLIVLLRQLETLYRAGIPIATGIDVLEHQTANRRLRATLRTISIEIREGLKLSESFERHPEIFPPMVTANVAAGEEAGALDEVLARLARHLEHEDELHRYILGSIRYPALVLTVLLGAITLIVGFVFPKLTPLFRLYGENLPLPTKILNGIATNALEYGPIVVASLAIAVVLFLLLTRSEFGRPGWERIKLGLPKVGSILRKLLVARFARAFAVVFRTGVPLLRALDIVAATLDHRLFSKEVRAAKLKMSSGSGIADALTSVSFFPPLAQHLLSVGERTGRVDDLCVFLADHFEEEARYELRGLIMLIEPALTVTLAVCVAFTALAVFLPMWGMMEVIKR